MYYGLFGDGQRARSKGKRVRFLYTRSYEGERKMGSSINIGWDKYETALLIEAYLRCRDGVLSRKDAISSLSLRLRQQKLKSGIAISDTFRNENGIALQMSAMEYCLTNGEHGLDTPSSLFKSIAEMYTYDPDSYNRLLYAANILYPEASGAGIDEPVDEKADVVREPQRRYVNEKIKNVLKSNFPKGYRLKSFIDTNRLKKYYLEQYEEPLDIACEDIDADVDGCTIVFDGRAYVPETMLGEEIKTQILDYIQHTFDDGNNFVFFTVLFDTFHDELLDSQILNSGMLGKYLSHFAPRKWHFTIDYIAYDLTKALDISSEVIRFVKEQGGIVNEDNVVSGLSYLPEDDVRVAFDKNSLVLVSCGRNQRFHIDNFAITDDDLQTIENLISRVIERYHYISFKELLADIRNEIPSVIDDNEVFTEIGIRNVLKIKLDDKFNFTNNIISSKGQPFTALDAFIALAMREAFTADEVKQVADDCGTIANVYIDTLLDHSVRVSREQFVAKRLVHFDVEATDDMLLKLYKDKAFMPLHGIMTFSVLPDCGYPWNDFLLECYVAKHSKQFRLIHSDYFNLTKTMGGIVKRSSGINDFVTLASYAIAIAPLDELKEPDVLNYLCEKGYIVQRRHKNVSEIIKNANIFREKLKNVRI